MHINIILYKSKFIWGVDIESLENFWDSYGKYISLMEFKGLENSDRDYQIKEILEYCLEELEKYIKQIGALTENLNYIYYRIKLELNT